MTVNHQVRRSLLVLIAVVGLLTAVWSAAMLAGGILAAGQLESEHNPLGESIVYVASFAIVSATALFYYCLVNRGRSPRVPLLLAGTLVAGLTIFVTMTQLVLVVDGSDGTGQMSNAETRIEQAWEEARASDRAMTDAYEAQLDYYGARMEEEARTGIGPRYREAERAHQELRAQFGASLGRGLNARRPGNSLSADAEAARGYLDRLQAKAETFARFAAREEIAVPDYGVRAGDIRARLDASVGEGWLDRRSVVLREVTKKLREMAESLGAADIGFTLSFLLAVAPDVLQLLCAILILILRPRGELAVTVDSDGREHMEWEADEPVWGEIPSKTTL